MIISGFSRFDEPLTEPLPSHVARDLEGRNFPIVPEAKTLDIVYNHGFRTAANVSEVEGQLCKLP